MAQDNRFDLTRLEQIERRLQVLEDAEAIRNLKARYAALCDNQYDADGIASLFTEDAVWESPALGRFEGRDAIRNFFRGSVEHLLLRDSLQSERPHRSGRRNCASPLVSVHAVHGSRRQSGDVARWYRSRDLRPGGRNLDVPSQAVRAADERAIRDRLGDGAFRVTGDGS
jgi:ketosteroid isomerase-like protein